MKRSLPILVLLITLQTIALGGNSRSSSHDLLIRLNGPVLYDETYLRFIEGASSEFDGNFDAYKIMPLNNSKPTLYTLTDSDIKLSINSLPDSLRFIKIDLQTIFRKAGTHSFSFPVIYNFPENFKFLLYDKLTDKKILLTDSVNCIFNVSASELFIDHSRFSLYIYPELEFIGYNHAFCSDSSSGVASFVSRNSTFISYNLYRDGNYLMSGNCHSDSLFIYGLIPGNYMVTSGDSIVDFNYSFNIKWNFPFSASFTIDSLNENTFLFRNTSAGKLFSYWELSDGYITNDSVFSHTFQALGNFDIKLISAGFYCSDSTSRHISVKSLHEESILTSVDINEKADLIIYNSSDRIYVRNEFQFPVRYLLEIYDLTGKLILSNSTTAPEGSQSEFSIPVSEPIMIARISYLDQFKSFRLLSGLSLYNNQQ